MPDTNAPSAPNDYFTTDFEPYLSLPGFFPGAGSLPWACPASRPRLTPRVRP